MSRLGKTIGWSVLGIMLLGILFFSFRLWVGMFNGDQFLIQWQFMRLIQNPIAIQSASQDQDTIQFLEHLPKNPSIGAIQIKMDHNNTVEHYEAVINGKLIDLYVQDIGWNQSFSITKISVNGLPKLPEFYMD